MSDEILVVIGLPLGISEGAKIERLVRLVGGQAVRAAPMGREFVVLVMRGRATLLGRLDPLTFGPRPEARVWATLLGQTLQCLAWRGLDSPLARLGWRRVEREGSVYAEAGALDYQGDDLLVCLSPGQLGSDLDEPPLPSIWAVVPPEVVGYA
jgi:hypothetical protein